MIDSPAKLAAWQQQLELGHQRMKQLEAHLEAAAASACASQTASYSAFESVQTPRVPAQEAQHCEHERVDQSTWSTQLEAPRSTQESPADLRALQQQLHQLQASSPHLVDQNTGYVRGGDQNSAAGPPGAWSGLLPVSSGTNAFQKYTQGGSATSRFKDRLVSRVDRSAGFPARHL
eukprot:TRINITY_DN6924_c0_g1_i3.p1 TRINITY_DN6924_c0_g1~~TRINITY_DN6924_c0_g1_i3.p1  ORF type:complete len:176 (+),score=47.01 TRINITY_DN6924_c0_g1_i3:245-772(+)